MPTMKAPDTTHGAPGAAPAARWEVLGVLVIVFISLFLNLWNNDFPLGYHPDEPKKVAFVSEGTQDFHHPILMLQVVRGLNAVLRLQSPEAVARLGRSSTAVFGAAAVLFAWLIFRRIVRRPRALLAALALALSPILVVHAHYLKEDVLFTCCALGALWCLLRLLESPSRSRTVWLGVATGLAFSSQYKGFLLLPFYAVVPLVSIGGRPRDQYARMAGAVLLAVVLFAAINWPMFTAPERFGNGLSFSAKHVLRGHTLKHNPLADLFGFHLVHSIGPGIGLPLTLLAVVSLLLGLLRWRHLGAPLKLLILFSAMFYAAAEASPSKPFPDFMRYMLPVVPGAVLLGFRLLETMDEKLGPGIRSPGLLLCLAIAATLGYESGRLTRDMRDDTRERAAVRVDALPSDRVWEPGRDDPVDDLAARRARGVRYVVANSFIYDRYLLGCRLEGQDPAVYTQCAGYRRLFEHRFEEIAPRFRTFAFSNPVVRIVDIGPVDSE